MGATRLRTRDAGYAHLCVHYPSTTRKAWNVGQGPCVLVLRRHRGCPYYFYVVFFFGLIGIEEVAHVGLIPESLGRSFLLVTGLGVIIWLVASIIFGVVMTFTKSATASPNPPLNRTRADNARAG